MMVSLVFSSFIIFYYKRVFWFFEGGFLRICCNFYNIFIYVLCYNMVMDRKERLKAELRRKGSTKAVETTIYDGGNVVQGEEAVRLGYMTEEELRAGDSSVYQRFAPLVRAYQ